MVKVKVKAFKNLHLDLQKLGNEIERPRPREGRNLILIHLKTFFRSYFVCRDHRHPILTSMAEVRKGFQNFTKAMKASGFKIW